MVNCGHNEGTVDCYSDASDAVILNDAWIAANDSPRSTPETATGPLSQPHLPAYP